MSSPSARSHATTNRCTQSLNDCLAGSEQFRRQFVACWGLPEDFRQIPPPADTFAPREVA